MVQNFEMMPDGSLRATLWDELVHSGHRRAAAGLTKGWIQAEGRFAQAEHLERSAQYREFRRNSPTNEKAR